MANSVEQKRRAFEDEALVHLDPLYGVALRLTGGEQARAEQLVREVFLEAWRSWSDHEPGTDGRAWLASLLRNTFLDAFRRRDDGRARVSDDETEGRPVRRDVQDGDREAAFLERLVDRELGEAIDGLDDALRVPLVLSDLEGFGYREIADALGIPVRTAKSRLHRARRRLLRRLREAAREKAPDADGSAGGDDESGGEGRPAGEGEGPPGGIRCEEARTRVYDYLDGELEPETQERIHRHLEVCRRCYPVFDFERLYLDHLLERGLAGAPPEGLEERVREALEAEA